MLKFFQRRTHLRQLLPGGVDAHCHLLPGVDDGAADMEESLGIIRGQQALGLRGAICTPHIMARLPQNTPTYLRRVFNDFVALLEGKGVATSSSRCSSTSESGNTPTYLRSVFEKFVVDHGTTGAAGSTLRNSNFVIRTSEGPFALHLAAEYMLDEAFPRHLASGDLLTIDSSLICPTTSGESSNRQSSIVNCQSPRFLLVELPQYLLPPGWQDMLDTILTAGYTPLLAHPERYLRILEEQDIRALVDRGIALQGNLGSLTGYYGSRVQKLAQSLRADGLYTTYGTDSHSAGMLQHLKLAA